MAAIPKNLRHLLLHGNKGKSDEKESDSDVELIPITGLEFKQFVKGPKDIEIVCNCFEPMFYTGQHNYKNMNYYVTECPTCTCKTPMNTIPYIKNSHYAVDPAFMRKDHEEERVVGEKQPYTSASGMKAEMIHYVSKFTFKHSSEPIYRIVDRNGHTESVQLTGTELLAYYKKQEIQRKSGVIEPLIWENVVKST